MVSTYFAFQVCRVYVCVIIIMFICTFAVYIKLLFENAYDIDHIFRLHFLLGIPTDRVVPYIYSMTQETILSNYQLYLKFVQRPNSNTYVLFASNLSISNIESSTSDSHTDAILIPYLGLVILSIMRVEHDNTIYYYYNNTNSILILQHDLK